jgi:ribosomal protein S18 acetylase RimI-like enzyme
VLALLATRPLSVLVSQTAMGSISSGEIEVVAASSVDEELIAAFNRLVPQLSRSAAVPTPELIREIVEAQASTVLIARDARDKGRIVGLLTLVVFRIPTGVRAWIEDVVVDEAVRGRGVGEALSQEAVRRAVGLGARTVELTSRPSREAANRLYERLGFVRRDSNVYRYTP